MCRTRLARGSVSQSRRIKKKERQGEQKGEKGGGREGGGGRGGRGGKRVRWCACRGEERSGEEMY